MISAYTTYFQRLPSYIQTTLYSNGSSELQPDGEILLAIRLEEKSTWNSLVEEIADASSLQVMDKILSSIEDTLTELTNKASCGQLSKTYTVIQLELLRAARTTRRNVSQRQVAPKTGFPFPAAPRQDPKDEGSLELSESCKGLCSAFRRIQI